MMLVCLPTTGNDGLAGGLHEHFGSAPFFTLVNTENEEVQIIENRNSHHSHGTCHPMTQLARYKIDAVICSGMGRRAVEALNADGIKTYLAANATVEEALKQLKDGKAEEIDPARACHGHGQHADGNDAPTLGHGHGLHGRGSGNQPGRGQGRKQGRGRGPGISRK